MKENSEYKEILLLMKSLSLSDKLKMVSFLRVLRENEDSSQPLFSSRETGKQ